jgi:hypothetical protein
VGEQCYSWYRSYHEYDTHMELTHIW